MSKYIIRYGRTINLGNYETARIELEEEFDTDNMPDKREAMYLVARMVEGWALSRKKYPSLFVPQATTRGEVEK